MTIRWRRTRSCRRVWTNWRTSPSSLPTPGTSKVVSPPTSAISERIYVAPDGIFGLEMLDRDCWRLFVLLERLWKIFNDAGSIEDDSDWGGGGRGCGYIKLTDFRSKSFIWRFVDEKIHCVCDLLWFISILSNEIKLSTAVLHLKRQRYIHFRNFTCVYLPTTYQLQHYQCYTIIFYTIDVCIYAAPIEINST